MYITTVICLALLLGEALYVVVNACSKKRHERIEFLRSFKKGKCAVIFITAIPLYVVGHMYAGEGFLNSFFKAINKIINLVVLKYDVSSIEGLMNESQIYTVTIYVCFVLVMLNALIFTLSLTSQHIWCFFASLFAYFTRKEKLYIFGNNEENVSIYKSDKKRNKVIIDSLTEKEREALYMDKIVYMATPSLKDSIAHIFDEIKKFERKIVLVINTGDDEKNINLCREIILNIDSLSEKDEERMFQELKVFVFGDPRYEAIYEDVVSSGFGCIHIVNKYQKIAVDFIDKYPLTQFMDERQIDYSTSLIKEGVDINVLLIGFGKTNQQIFLTSVANNQFLTSKGDTPCLKRVKYMIFDKDNSENNKNLNHSYYRYENEMASVNPDDYLPLPELPAEPHYFKLDINDKNFYKQIKEIVTENENDASYIIIAFGTDLENIDMAQKLVEKRQEWGLDRLVIFVKVRNYHKEETLLEQDNCFFIGNEFDTVFDIENILGDKLFQMAKMRNALYDLEYDITHNKELEVTPEYVAENEKRAEHKWYKEKTQLERDSSLYCCLSLRSKLHLMGLDYCPKDDERSGIETNEEYLKIYATKKDMPILDKYEATVQGKPIVYYPLELKKSRRWNMAYHEHMRWNSFMISKGLVPSTLEQIKNETYFDEKKGKIKHSNGKSYRLRRHGNITTFDGLVTFRQIISNRDKTDEREEDVIKYDYQLLDDAFYLLDRNQFKIIKRV